MRTRAMIQRAIVLAAVILGLTTCAVSANGIVFDDYVLDTQTAQEPHEDPSYDENEAFSDEDAAVDENNDGDDTYVSNDGTTFRIPRAGDPSERMFDYAGIFTAEQQAGLRERIAKLEKKKDCDIIVMVTSAVPRDINNGSETTQKYIQQFYIDNHFSTDGTGFIIDLNNRVMWSVGSGKYRTEKFVDFSQKVYNDCLPVARKGDYFAAAQTFLRDFEAYENPLMAAIPTPLSLIISGVAALLGMLGFNVQHGKTQPSKKATPPVTVRDYRVLKHNENYLGTTVTRRHIPRHRDTGDSGGGGGFSGGFSSGGFSSGGGSFSGGGGKF